jgi:hypothetical protein
VYIAIQTVASLSLASLERFNYQDFGFTLDRKLGMSIVKKISYVSV